MTGYRLMNGNDEVAILDIIQNVVYVKEIKDKLPYWIRDPNEWLQNRAKIFGRANTLQLAKIAGINTTEDFVKIAKALSVTDTLWVDDMEHPIYWDKVNPYRNRISTLLANIAIDGWGITLTAKVDAPSPQYRLSGSVEKCVKREGKNIYLYKTAGECWSDLAGKRPYSEYFASKLEEKLGFQDYTKYDIVEKEVYDEATNAKYVKPYCRCPIFTSEEVGLAECSDTKYIKYGIEQILKELPQTNKETLREMILLDSIILNTDRHRGNFGFRVDNKTLQLIGIAPIYDNDCSLGATTSLQFKSFDEAYREIMTTTSPKTNMGDYDEQAIKVITPTLYKKLKSVGTIKFTRGNLMGISQNRVDFINYLINRRIKEIIQLTEKVYHINN